MVLRCARVNVILFTTITTTCYYDMFISVLFNPVFRRSVVESLFRIPPTVVLSVAARLSLVLAAHAAFQLIRSQACLFSVVTSAFIIEVHSNLQQDPTMGPPPSFASLLARLKIDNTTFGNDPPTYHDGQAPQTRSLKVNL